MQQPSNLDVALSLARSGYFVFPTRPNKSPYIPAWQSGSRDEAQIRAWWQSCPDALPALPCGINRLLVVDCDVKNGIDGNVAWDKLCVEQGLKQNTCMIVNTPSGGRHFYFRQTNDELIRNTASKIAPAIDTRGDGGYVIAAGAKLADGSTYEVVRGDINSVPDLPTGLDEFLRSLKPIVTTQNNSSDTPSTAINYQSERVYALKALQDETAKVSHAIAGTRNDRLNTAAYLLGTFIQNGGISRGEIEDALWKAATQAGLKDGEIAQTVQSGINAGINNPRQAISIKNQNLRNGVDLSKFKVNTQPPTSVHNSKEGLVPVRISDVKPESITWLWKNRFAMGKLSIIAGEPGLGKSQLTAYIAARISTGTPFPNDDGAPLFGNVILLSCEDDIADTIRPRLEAAGADINRIHAIYEHRAKDGKLMPVSLVEHISELEAMITNDPEMKLLIVDPISAYLNKIDTHKTSDVRTALAPLQTLAQKHNIAVVIVSHFNKNAGNGRATNAVTGSGAFVAASRATFIVTEGQSDKEGLRLFVEAKNNLGKAKALAFRVESKEVHEGITAPYIVFEDGEIDVDANELLGPPGQSDNRPKLNEAIHFLRVELSEGPMFTTEIKKRAKEEGISDKTLRDARKELGLLVEKEGYQGRWIWRLPFDLDEIMKADAETKVPKNSKGAPVKNTDTFDNGWPSLDKSKDEGGNNDR